VRPCHSQGARTRWRLAVYPAKLKKHEHPIQPPTGNYAEIYAKSMSVIDASRNNSLFNTAKL
jgi:hypothetical protein